MNTKKYLVSAGVISVLLAGASFAFAQDSVISPATGMMPSVKVQENNAQQMVLQVGPRGEVLMRGTISVVGTSSLTVKSWGGDWMVNVPTTAQVLPGTTTLSQFTVGDFVGVQGVVSQSALWTIDAKLVRDWTVKKAVREEKQTMRTERHNNAQEIKDVIKNESPKNWQGTVNNINVDAKTFTLTVDGTAYTVNLVTDATTVNQGFLSISLANVKEGDTVRVWGPVTDTTISAYVFRDTSVKPQYDVKANVK